MQHIELRLASIQERQSLLRSIRDADRAADRNAAPPSIRSFLGSSLIRLGERIAGERRATPVWTG
jgi:hypothetical protein